MLKTSSIAFLLFISLNGQLVSSVPFSPNILDIELANPDYKISKTLVEHSKDFLELINVESLVASAIPYMKDPEVLNFVTFVISEEFKKIIWELESLSEFKKAIALLADKGYDVELVLNFINSALQLPPFEIAQLLDGFSIKDDVNFKGTGMTGLIEDIIEVLPLEDMKALFESKLETSPEVAELFETITSPEYLDIMREMSKNPKFIEIKNTFAGYGFDFKYLCTLAKEIFGKYFQGVFCEN